MNHRLNRRVRHCRARYPQPRLRPSRGPGPGLLRLALVLAVLAVPAVALGAPRTLRANGRWASFNVRSPGGHHAFLFECRAGARYRITLKPGTLERPWMELFWGAQASAPVSALPGTPGALVTLLWQAEVDAVTEIRVKGFSAATGKGKLKLETLDPSGNKAAPGARFLAPVSTPVPAGAADVFQVGDLLLGESNAWELVVEPGKAYEVRSSKGTAGGIRLRVMRGREETVANSDAWRQAGIHYPTLRFRVPAVTSEARPEPLRLVVEGVWSSAGTYGVLLDRLSGEQTVEPEILSPVKPVTRGLGESGSLTFTLNEGDMAVLWVPQANPLQARQVQMRLRGRWMPAGGRAHGMIAHGDFAAGRRPGSGHFYSFRPYQPGTYRFTGLGRRVQSAASLETLRLYSRAELGAAPVHMGTNSDPTDKARTGRRWMPIGLAICVPGVTYLFVARDAPAAGVGMRVRTLDGQTVALRRATLGSWPTAPGYGPSMRFRVAVPGVVRLETKGGKRIVRALLRELQSDD